VALAAERLIAGMGVSVVPFSVQEAKLFSILPSISQTRKLLPELVSQKDESLQYRGTAVVMQVLLCGRGRSRRGYLKTTHQRNSSMAHKKFFKAIDGVYDILIQ